MTRDASDKAKDKAPLRVENAIILAAGAGTHFVPWTHVPKALLDVKGEILIERMIRQLHAAEIFDITIVVGYMAKSFAYLADKYNVSIVENKQYFKQDSAGSLYLVSPMLESTYLCTGDTFFAQSPFRTYESSPYFIETKGNKITGCAYIDPASASAIKEKLKEAKQSNTIDTLCLCDLLPALLPPLTDKDIAQPLPKDALYLDSFETLRAFDSQYSKCCDSEAMQNICGYFDCTPDELSGFTVMKVGMTNNSFHFDYNGHTYVYRHPGKGTEKFINREAEAFALEVAKSLGIDDTLVYIDPKIGWKLSHFIFDCQILDYRDMEQVKTAMTLIRKLHDAAIECPWEFNMWNNAVDFVEKIGDQGTAFSEDYDELYRVLEKVYTYTEKGNFPKHLCHCDFFNPNLIYNTDRMYLIDWEYAGNSDPGADIGTFICCSDYTYEEAIGIFELYKQRPLTPDELRHFVAYVAIAAYYWFVWAVYQEMNNASIGEYLRIWHDYAKLYGERALEMYES